VLNVGKNRLYIHLYHYAEFSAHISIIRRIIIPDSSTRALGQLPAETSTTEAEETWAKKLPMNFAYEVKVKQSRCTPWRRLGGEEI
jgi:hypothetical protein